MSGETEGGPTCGDRPGASIQISALQGPCNLLPPHSFSSYNSASAPSFLVLPLLRTERRWLKRST